MKYNILYLSVLSLVLFCTSCEQEVEVYNMKGNDRLDFTYENYYLPDTLINYTFLFTDEDQMTDTIWLEVATSGFVTDYQRPVAFEQLEINDSSAVAGKHYVAFDDPAMKDVYVVPANANYARLPLILKKDDPELKKKRFTLKFSIKENAYFKNGTAGYQERTVTISNKIEQPKHWNEIAVMYFAGTYGPVKYQFMIDVARKEKGLILDDNFFYEVTGGETPGSTDMAYTDYLRAFFTKALAKENAEREKQGFGPLREDPKPGETEGEVINFDRPR